MSRHTEIVPKKVLSGSENPQVQSKPSYKLWFPSKSPPRHQRAEAHRNNPQKLTQWVEKPTATVKTEQQTMILYEIVSWASTCRGTPKQSPKMYSAGRKTPQVQSKPSNRLWFRTNCLLGNSVSWYTEIVLKNMLRRSKNPQVHSYLWRSYRLYRYIYDTRASI